MECFYSFKAILFLPSPDSLPQDIGLQEPHQKAAVFFCLQIISGHRYLRRRSVGLGGGTDKDWGRGRQTETERRSDICGLLGQAENIFCYFSFQSIEFYVTFLGLWKLLFPTLFQSRGS